MKITELKSGIWYGNTNWTKTSYAKFSHHEQEKFYYEESYYTYYRKRDLGYWSTLGGKYFEVPITELNNFLPYKLELYYEIY